MEHRNVDLERQNHSLIVAENQKGFLDDQLIMIYVINQNQQKTCDFLQRFFDSLSFVFFLRTPSNVVHVNIRFQVEKYFCRTTLDGVRGIK